MLVFIVPKRVLYCFILMLLWGKGYFADGYSVERLSKPLNLNLYIYILYMCIYISIFKN